MRPVFSEEVAKALDYQKYLPEKKDWVLGAIIAFAVLSIFAVALFAIVKSANAESVDLHGMVEVGSVGGGLSERVTKYYDYDNGVVCYSNKMGYSGGISCVQN